MYNLKTTQATKEEIIHRASVRDIYEYYVGVPITNENGSLVNVASPFRNDNNASLGFNKWDDVLLWKDFGTGAGGNVWGFVMRLYGCTYYEALNNISNDMGLGILDGKCTYIRRDKPPIQKSALIIQFTTKPFTIAELEYWGQYGISEYILKMHNVFSVEKLLINKSTVVSANKYNPIYAYMFEQKDSVKIYRPFNPKRKFLSNVTGIENVQGLDQLGQKRHTNNPCNKDVVIITKSLKDVMCLYSLGYAAIAPHGESNSIDEKLIDFLKENYKKVIIFYDNDVPGIMGATKLSAIHNLEHVYIPIGEPKDITDYYAKYGRDICKEMLKQLINAD